MSQLCKYYGWTPEVVLNMKHSHVEHVVDFMNEDIKKSNQAAKKR